MTRRVAVHEAAQIATREKTEAAQRAKLSGISTDLLGWCATNGFELTDERVKRIHDLVANSPASAEVLFEIAHCASSKHAAVQRELTQQASRMKTETLQARVDSIIEKRQNAKGPVNTHTASASPAPSNPYSSSGSSTKRPLEARFVRNGVPPASLLESIKRQRTSMTGNAAAHALYTDFSKR
jgi:hypothetical protein